MTLSSENDAVLPQDGAGLPTYISKTEEGVFVDTRQAIPDAALEQYVNRLFVNGARFADLDYSSFLALLYHLDTVPVPSSGKVRIAADIVRFPAPRQALYKTLKILDDGARAEYAFEPVKMETVFDEPVYGEPGPDGVSPIVDYNRRIKEVPTRLDFDEFVAAMWLKSLRYGIDATAVKRAILSSEMSRVDVAEQLPATEGVDAEMVPANEGLQRDDSPKVLANGKADLRRFKNRFPHVAFGERLVKKTHPIPGRPGRKVTGATIEPAPPKDFDLLELAGPGTRVDAGAREDYIVAAIDGFLTLDIASNQVSVTEKIENRAGISVRTTGDLALAVDEFVEHGEVQEGRVVEGKHMTFKADVFGAISALNGNISIESNLSGGSARSMGGDVSVLGRTSCATIEAWDGTVRLQFAEGCTIAGRTVFVEHAINCEILAEELHLGRSEGCGITARKAVIGTADMRRNQETVLTLAVPDMAVFDQKITEARKAAASAASLVEARVRAVDAAKSDAEFAKFLALAVNIRSGAVKLTDAQVANWKKLESRFATQLARLQGLEEEKQTMLAQHRAAVAEVERLCAERKASGQGIGCEILEVRGDTVVQTAPSSQGLVPWRQLGASELKTKLNAMSTAEARLFAGDAGSFAWRYAVPELNSD